MAQAKLELLLELKNRLKAGLSTAKNSVLTSMKDMKSKLSDFTASNMQAFKGIADQIPGVGSALSLLANPYALAAAAALSFGAATVKATSMALDWEKSMAKVNVTAQLGKRGLSGLSNEILEIGSRGSNDLMLVPEAFNRIISAGLDTNQSLKALEPTLKAAKAGFTDIETVAAAGIGVMKSSGKDINLVYDTLFATLNKGNAEFKDIAQYLPKIIPGSRLAGAELYETAGAFAFLTAQGQTAEQSTTGLMNAFKALSDPRFTQGFKEIGVNIFEKGKFRGLLPIVSDLKNRMHGLSDEQAGLLIKTIGLDQEARMAFGTMIQNVSELKTTLEFVKNSTGQLELAVKNAKTATDDWATGWNKMKAGAIEFGQVFTPLVETTGRWFNMLVQGRKGSGLLVEELQGLKLSAEAEKKELQDILSTEKNSSIRSQLEEAIKAKDSSIEEARNKVLTKFQDEINELKNNIEFYNKRLKGGLTLDQTLETRKDLADTREKLRLTREGFKDFVIGSNKPDSVVNQEKDSSNSDTQMGLNNASATSVQQSKSISIHIDSIHKGDINVKADTEGMSLYEFEKNMNEILLRTIRNVEASY